MTKSTPAIWAIGDVQGCHQPLQRLLAHPEIAQDPNAQFWFCGDLVNRGSQSVSTLDTVMALEDRAVTVLGNHDIHALAVFANVRKSARSDTLDALLGSPRVHEYMDWLRHRPLAHYAHGHLLVHAGVLPPWSVEQTLALAGEVEHLLRGPDWRVHLAHLFGNKPRRWRDTLQGPRRWRLIINALTRMRICTVNGRMDFDHKGKPVVTDDYMPWFDVPDRAAQETTIVFGHWSALGLMIRPNAICLDTGCAWGRHLSALRLQDRRLVQVACNADHHPGVQSY